MKRVTTCCNLLNITKQLYWDLTENFKGLNARHL